MREGRTVGGALAAGAGGAAWGHSAGPAGRTYEKAAPSRPVRLWESAALTLEIW